MYADFCITCDTTLVLTRITLKYFPNSVILTFKTLNIIPGKNLKCVCKGLPYNQTAERQFPV